MTKLYNPFEDEPEIDEDKLIRCMCDHDIDAGGNCRYRCGYSIDSREPDSDEVRYELPAFAGMFDGELPPDASVTVKDRVRFEGGGMRDSQTGKPRFDLLLPEGVPFEKQYLTRVARLMARGADHYADRNWEKFGDLEALNRAKSSAFRHFMQWICGETDEDHAASIFFNVMAAEYIKEKISE